MILWTDWHLKTLLPFFVLAGALAWLIGWLMRNKSEKAKLLPIKIIGLVLVALEIAKQIYCLVVGYDFDKLPLHFCSLFVFIIPFMAFYNGKHKDVVRTLTLTCCMMLFVFMLVYPNLIYGGEKIPKFFSNFLSFHTVFYHNLVIFTMFLLLAFKLYSPNTKKDLLAILVFYLGYGVIGGSAAQIFKTNFNNFYDCPGFPPIEAVRQSMVQAMGGFGQFLYVAAIVVVMVIFAYLCYGLLRAYIAIRKKITKKS